MPASPAKLLSLTRLRRPVESAGNLVSSLKMTRQHQLNVIESEVIFRAI